MAMSGTQLWDYSSLEGLMGVLSRVAAEIAQNKQGLERDTAAVRNGQDWTGAAQAAWLQLQASYDQLTLHFSEVMAQFGTQVGQARTIAQTTDHSIAGTFSG